MSHATEQLVAGERSKPQRTQSSTQKYAEKVECSQSPGRYRPDCDRHQPGRLQLLTTL